MHMTKQKGLLFLNGVQAKSNLFRCVSHRKNMIVTNHRQSEEKQSTNANTART